jgi:hypothetical protein
MALQNFYIDLDTKRFVQPSDLNVGLRTINLTEGESYSGDVFAYVNGESVSITSFTLSLNNKNNNLRYSDASVTSPDYTLSVTGTALRNDIAPRLSLNALLDVEIVYNGENYDITPLPVKVIANASYNDGSSNFYPLTTNPSGYVTTGLLVQTSGVIIDQIQASSSGTSVRVTGSSSMLIADFSGIGGANVIRSGNNVLVSGGAGGASNTGELTGAFYPLRQNPSGYIQSTTGLISNGQLLIGSSGDNAFIQGNLGGVSGIITQSGSGSLIISTDSTIVKTSQTGGFLDSSVTGNFVTNGMTGGFSSVKVTGSPLLPLVNLTGAGNVTVATGANPLVIVSGNTGAYSNFLTPSSTGGFVNTTMTGLLTNTFVLRSETGGFGGGAGGAAGVSTLGATGTTNTGFFTGNILVSGAGNIVASTGNTTSKLIVVSGNTGAYANFITPSMTGGFVDSTQSGLLTNVFYPLSSNPAGYITSSSNVGVRSIRTTGAFPSGTISGNVTISGISSISVTTGAAGQIVISGNTGMFDNFTSDSELLSASGYIVSLINASAAGVSSLNGQSGVMQILGSGNITIFTGAGFITVSGNTGAYANFITPSQTGGFLDSSDTGNFVTTQQSGLLTNVFYPLSSNPSNYLTVSNEVGVRRIIPTGTTNSGLISGNVILTGAGNVSTFTGISGHIVVSGNTGMFSNFVSLSQTGNVVNTSMTGGFSSIKVTGSPLLPLVNLTGAGNVTVTTGGVGGSLVTINGNTGAYSSFVSLSQTGGFLTLGNVGGVRTLQTTGAFPSGFVSGNVIISGVGTVSVTTGVNGNLIVISGTSVAGPGGAAGVSSIAATGTTNTGYHTGDVMFSGAGNIVVSTGTPINKLIVVSGNTGAYSNFLTPSSTGSLTNAFYPLVGNPSGFLQGVTGTGILDGQLLIGASGINGFEQGHLGGVSGIFIVSGSGSLLVGIDSTIVRTSQTGGFGGSGGGSSVQITGVTVSNPNFTGVGTVTVTTGGGGLVLVSGRDITSFASENKFWIPAAAMTPSQITGATTGQIFTAGSGHTIDTLNFLSGNGQSAYFNLAFPKVWNKSTVTPVFYWTTTGNAGTINWGIAGANIDDGTRLDIQYNQGTTISDSTISGNYLHQTTGAPLTISGSLLDDDQCYFKVYRSAGGSLASEGQLIGLSLAYTETGLGSVSIGGVSSLNGLTGSLNLTGAGTITVTTGTNLITISGSSVAGPGGAAGVSTIGATGITNTGYFTGDVLFSGAGNIVASTGNNNSKLIVISGNTGMFANFVSLSQTGNVVNTSMTGGFTSFKVTGSPLLPLVNLTGAGNVTTVTGDLFGTVIVSGNTGAYSSFVTLSQTGGLVSSANTGTFVTTGMLSGTHEIWISAGAMTPIGATTGILNTGGSVGLGGLVFDVLDFSQTASLPSATFNLAFPQRYNNDTVKGQFYWTETGGTGVTGSVVWGLTALTRKNNNPFSNITFGTGQLVTGISATGERVHQAVTPFLTISGSPRNADLCMFKVYRNSGSLSANARLIGLSLQFYDTGIVSRLGY